MHNRKDYLEKYRDLLQEVEKQKFAVKASHKSGTKKLQILKNKSQRESVQDVDQNWCCEQLKKELEQDSSFMGAQLFQSAGM